jgi:hypothetical protein
MRKQVTGLKLAIGSPAPHYGKKPEPEPVMLKRILSIFVFLGLFSPTFAQAPTGLEQLEQTMQVDRLFRILALEGDAFGQNVDAQILGGRGGQAWKSEIRRIYAPETGKAVFRAVFAKQLEGADIAAMERFFASPTGKRIIGLELSAREAFLEQDVEQGARDRFREMVAKQDRRVDLLNTFVEVNDLVGFNVMGTLNSNLAFMKAFVAEGGADADLSEQDILAETLGQEEDARKEAREWLFPYLSLAYQPLSDTELEAYIAFSQTRPGRDLNSALFAAFDVLFIGISGALGQSAARALNSEAL